MQKDLKGYGLLLVSMESIAEILDVKRQCSSCKVLRDEDQFAGCAGKCSFLRPVKNAEILRRGIGTRRKYDFSLDHPFYMTLYRYHRHRHHHTFHLGYPQKL